MTQQEKISKSLGITKERLNFLMETTMRIAWKHFQRPVSSTLEIVDDIKEAIPDLTVSEALYTGLKMARFV